MAGTSSPIPSSLLLPFKDDINAALATRYLTLIAAAIQVADLLTSHRAERKLIWPTRNSPTKWAILVNRYLVPTVLILAFVPLSGFIGLELSDQACLNWATVVTFIAVCSMGTMNGLVSWRIITLWDYDRRITTLMVGSTILVYAVSAVSIIIALTQKSKFEWSPLLSMCIVTKASPLAVITWAVPMVFELLVLGVLVWNTLDRPRTAQTSLFRSLRADGATYYTIITVLRALQTGMIASANRRTYLLLNGLVWSLVTITTHRALFALRRAEVAEGPSASRNGNVDRRTQSPFGGFMSPDRKSSMGSIQMPMQMPAHMHGRASPIELMRRVDVEYAHR